MAKDPQHPKLEPLVPPRPSAFEEIDRWDPEAAEVLSNLLRALRRKQGFGLFFVQCNPAQGQRVIQAIQARFPQKRLVQFALNRETETLYGELLESYQAEPFEVACVTGVEQAMYGYEDTKRLAGWSSEEIYNYSWKGLPPLLNHLNRQREAFEANLPIALIFLVPSFVIDYFVQRAPDFFDWRSGFFKFTENIENAQKTSQELTGKPYKEYLELTADERIQRILEIKDKILRLNTVDCKQRSLLFREQGRLFEVDGDFKRALDCYSRALLADPEDHETWVDKGRLLDDMERYEEALSSYECALKNKPNYYKAWYYRGNALYHLDRYEKAIESYNSTLLIKPDYVYALNSKGLVFNAMGNHHKALANFNRALKLKDDVDFAWFNHGRTLEELNRIEEAIESYKKALKISPKKYFIWMDLGCAYRKLGRYEEAAKVYDHILGNEPDYYRAWMGRSYVLSRKKEYEEALSDIDRALICKPDFIPALFRRALLLERLGRYDEALSIYRRCGEINSDNIWNYCQQAYGFYNSLAYKEAVSSFEAALHLLVVNPSKRSWYAKFSGIEIALKSNPKYYFYYGLSISLLKMGRRKEALGSFKDVCLSKDLYTDALKVIWTIGIAAIQGRLQCREIDEDFNYWLRHFGFRR